jgi:small subunit ribosomal protein S1
VNRLANFGLFIQLENGLEGLAHISEIPGISSKNLERSFQPGDRVMVQILNIDHDNRKIALSFKDVPTSTGAPAV